MARMGESSFSVSTESFFDGYSLHGPTRISVVDGAVVDITPHDGPCDHHLVSPGLVDLQLNGWSDVDFSSASRDDIVRIDGELASLGTTSYLATLVTDSLGRMQDRAGLLARIIPGLGGMVGIHLEGPFLGRAPGAHRRDRIIDLDAEWLRGLPAVVRLVTVGAEQNGLAAVVEGLVSAGVAVSIGHSLPSETEYESAVAAGARMCTHLFNAMSGVHHRDFGLALAALTDERVVAGLISDMHHVSPRAVSLAFRARPDGIILVSDSVAWGSEGARARSVELRDGAPRLPDGTLAGSSTCLAECVRLAVTEAGVDLARALRAATTVPSFFIGMPDRGVIINGSPADLVAYSDDLRVVRTWRRLVSSRGTPTDD